jgi:hypothetical protein
MSQGGANPNVATANSTPVRAIFAGDYAAADEGSYYTAWLGATASTAVAVTTQALGTSSPHIVIQNVNPAGGYNMYLRSIKLRVTTATTGITSVYHVGVLNPNPAAFTTTGTALNGPTNVNSNSGTTSRNLIWGGVNVCTTQASSPGSRIVHTGPVTSIIPIVLDQWMFSFGDAAVGNAFGTVIGTTTSFISVSCPPVIIAPGWFYSFGLWGPSWAASAPSYTYDVAFIERPAGQ